MYFNETEKISEIIRGLSADMLALMPAVKQSAQNCGEDAVCINALTRSAYENLRTAQNLGAYSKLSVAQPKKEPFCVTNAVQNFVFGAKYICKTAEITVKNASTPIWVNASEDLFLISLGNIIYNSIIYAGDNPQIKICLYKNKGNAIIKVHDNAKGMRPETVYKVFSPFVSFDPYDNAAPQPGLGLGLAIVKKFTNAYGGRLVTESRFGVGSVVTLVLPICEKGEKHKEHNFLCDRYSTLYTQLCGVCTLPI